MFGAFPNSGALVEAMISVAGVVSGTPIADRFTDLYERLASRVTLSPCPPGDGRGVASLSRAERMAWLSSHRLPPSVRYYSLAALAPRDRISRALLPFYDLLSQVDPKNDGQVVYTDSVIPGSTMLGYAVADHWAVALPFESSGSILQLGADKNSYPRPVLIRAILDFLDEEASRTQ